MQFSFPWIEGLLLRKGILEKKDHASRFSQNTEMMWLLHGGGRLDALDFSSTGKALLSNHLLNLARTGTISSGLSAFWYLYTQWTRDPVTQTQNPSPPELQSFRCTFIFFTSFLNPHGLWIIN